MKISFLTTAGGNKAGQQLVVRDGNKVGFQSYNSYVAEYEGGTLTLFENWDYSATTMRYLGQFLRDVVRMNIKGTGDLRKKSEISGVKIVFATDLAKAA